MKISNLEGVPVMERQDLLAKPVADAIRNQNLSEVEVVEIDPSFADTASFCENYKVGLIHGRMSSEDKETIMKDFKEEGYKTQYKVLNAADFGVPQKRMRVIILGTREDVEPRIFHPKPTHDNKWLTVRDAISDLPESEDPNIPNHHGTKHRVKVNGFIGNRATKWDEPSPTIVGRGGGTGGPVIIPHPNLHRRMTVRETARLQSFPDDFIFYGSISSQYRQIGNAVPWPLAFNIAKVIPLSHKSERQDIIEIEKAATTKSKNLDEHCESLNACYEIVR